MSKTEPQLLAPALPAAEAGRIYVLRAQRIRTYSSRTFALSATVQPCRLDRIVQIIPNIHHVHRHPLPERGRLI